MNIEIIKVDDRTTTYDTKRCELTQGSPTTVTASLASGTVNDDRMWREQVINQDFGLHDPDLPMNKGNGLIAILTNTDLDEED